jgi:uncharacterized small protein (TIGR04563 family)
MAGTDKRKQSLYFPEQMLNEIRQEAERQDRSLSWIIQRAWLVARDDMKRIPTTVEPVPDSSDSDDD